jgi:hypothetical protein
MTFEYIVLPDKRCIAQRFTGALTLDDVVACTETMWADTLYDQQYDIISDLTLSTAAALPRDVYSLISFLKRPETSKGRCAAIFSDPKATALGYFFKSLSTFNHRMRVFSTWEAASEHLQVDIAPSVFSRET